MNKRRPHSVDWNQISRYLSGEMSDEEVKAFEEHLAGNPEYSQLVTSANKDWETLEQIQGQDKKVNVDKAWNTLHHRLCEDDLVESPHRTVFWSSWSPILQFAAMIVVVMGLALASYQIFYTPAATMESMQTAFHEGGKTVNLSDGSRVFLNGNSTLTFPDEFHGNRRMVTLQGEAFFEIAPNAKKPFIITANNAQIKVLGTTFNVNTHGKQVEVLVKSGIVQLLADKGSGDNIILKKGDFGIIQKDRAKRADHPGNNYLSWKSRHLVFKGENLEEVARQIGHAYQINIHFDDPSLKDFRLTATFNQQTLENIMESICLSFSMMYEQNENQIKLYKRVQ